MEVKPPVLYVVIPCYNEQDVLPVTAPQFLKKVCQLADTGKISPQSRILFVNDGSKDETWSLVNNLAAQDEHYAGISLSRNRGHQNALLAGLMEAKDLCDITISIDCDGQDDINAMDGMVDAYLEGCDVVYGVRSSRQSDTFFKRFTAEAFYKLLSALGADVVFNHADYRLLSARALHELANFKEVNLFLRGMVPLVGFKSTCVEYVRQERVAGEGHYPLSKMLALAFDGITSLSVKPIRFITGFGVLVAMVSFVAVIWTVVQALLGKTVLGWASMTAIICFVSGVQLICLGIIGEYIGKIYMETKARPRYIVSEKTDNLRGGEEWAMKQLVDKYKGIVSYLFFGVCTTLVNIFAYYACVHWLGLQNVVSTFIAWVVSVLFAYFTNKVFVFESRSWKWNALLREMALFFACRGVTGAMDILIMYVGVDLMGMLDMGVKVFSNILVIILNYVMSKLLIFRRGASSAKGE